MTITHILSAEGRYYVRGVGPIVSPALRWDAARMRFFARGVSYSVDVVRFVRPVTPGTVQPWIPIDQCRSGGVKHVADAAPYAALSLAVLAMVCASPGLTRRVIADRVGAAPVLVSRVLRRLREQGKVKRSLASWRNLGTRAYRWLPTEPEGIAHAA